MGAILGAVLPDPLTATRDFAERVLAAASPCIPTPLERNRASAICTAGRKRICTRVPRVARVAPYMPVAKITTEQDGDRRRKERRPRNVYKDVQDRTKKQVTSKEKIAWRP